MKIVIGSNSPFTNSGYGIQSYFLCKSFIEAGHDVVFLAWNMTGTKDLQYKKISYEKLKDLSLQTAFYHLKLSFAQHNPRVAVPRSTDYTQHAQLIRSTCVCLLTQRFSR